jgi:hypothetical protein
MTDRRILSWLCLTGLAACSSEGPGSDFVEHSSEGFTQLQVTKRRSVDILIVLDNSSSMAEEQALLANNLGPWIEILESDEVRADYRIAITTTDAGHPSCPATTPERGAFMLTPCTSRLDEFVADGEGGPSDVRATACNDICTLGASQLAILPTPTDEDPTPKPRPWLERIDGRSNLPADVEMPDAMSCFGPQGVAGCDFEAPLESMYQALLRTQDATDPAYGFLRQDAELMVIIITDEDDCSPAPGAEEFFSADSTSAACWTAGVTCTGDPTHYDSCEAVDDDAVLQPPSRYADLLDGIMADKRMINPNLAPMIGLVAGAAGDGQIYFGEVGDTDPEFQQTFGIGPTCIAPGSDPDRPIRATPPVRLVAAQEAVMGLETIISVCEGDWTPVIGQFGYGGWSGPQIRPACFTHCALDTDPSTTTLEPDCIVEEELPNGDTRHIEECLRGEQGYLIDPDTNDYSLPPGADVCHARLTDSTLATPDSNDDLSPECVDRGFNLQFEFARRPGHPTASGTRVTATCSLSEQPSITCPELED